MHLELFFLYYSISFIFLYCFYFFYYFSFFFFFFFQAEDGIRDPLVTGVQTCALPIWKAITFFIRRDLRTRRQTSTLQIHALLRTRQLLRDADALETVGRQHRVHRHRKVYQDPARSETRACRQAPCAGTGRSHVCLQRRELQTVSGSQRRHADDGVPRARRQRNMLSECVTT